MCIFIYAQEKGLKHFIVHNIMEEFHLLWENGILKLWLNLVKILYFLFLP